MLIQSAPLPKYLRIHPLLCIFPTITLTQATMTPPLLHQLPSCSLFLSPPPPLQSIHQTLIRGISQRHKPDYVSPLLQIYPSVPTALRKKFPCSILRVKLFLVFDLISLTLNCELVLTLLQPPCSLVPPTLCTNSSWNVWGQGWLLLPSSHVSFSRASPPLPSVAPSHTHIARLILFLELSNIYMDLI